jgi:iron complex outermembrane recepter protein
MKKNYFQNNSKKYNKKVFILLFVLINFTSFAQQIKGKVTDNKGETLIGATATIKGSTKGTTTNVNGEFLFENISNGNYTLIVSSIGYTTKEVTVKVPQSRELKILLEESTATLEEVVVTGVFDQRKRIDASVAISTISENQIKMQAPASAADLLKNIPGVYVNSSVGEVGNQVTVRGTPTTNISITNSNASGYLYVTMQEDGLPVTNITGSGFGPDYFLRADVNVKRIEAVRGGSSSITGSDAPGGLFNYVSKEGSNKFSGDLTLKYGLEGNANPFRRVDLGFGGALNKKGDITYYVGGFYRKSDGARTPGFALNDGGQIRANIVKKYKGGSIKFYAKYLNDRNGRFDLIPYTDFTNPSIASGFKNTDNLASNGKESFDFLPYTGSSSRTFDPRKLNNSIDKTFGLNWNHTFAKGWKIDNKFKFSSKISDNNTQFPAHIGDANLFFLQTQPVAAYASALATLTDAVTGGQVNLKSPLLLSFGQKNDRTANEIMEQFIIQKAIGKSNFTLGAYYGRTDYTAQGGLMGLSIATVQHNPHPIVATFRNPTAGLAVEQLTNQYGFFGLGDQTYTDERWVNNRLDVFFAQTTSLTDKLTLDYGIRYNSTNFKGTIQNNVGTTPSSKGGADNNPLTLYDNKVRPLGNIVNFDLSGSSVSYSGALNYKFSDNQAIYVRYSGGTKAPDITSNLNTLAGSGAQLESTLLSQIEAGFKLQKEKLRLNVTPFYTKISNLADISFAADEKDVIYYLPPAYSEQKIYGIELDGNIDLSSQFNLSGSVTLQNPKYIIKREWFVGVNGKADDKLVEFKDRFISLTPRVMASIMPSYNTNKINALLTYRFIGSAPANEVNAFSFPAYNQVDFTIGYKFIPRMRVSFNVNNMFNELGVTAWNPPPGDPVNLAPGLPAISVPNLSPNSFTPERVAAQANATWSARTTLPRSFFLTLSYNF